MNLFRAAAVIGVLALTSVASASYTEYGKCRIRCCNGATAGPYWSTDTGCCEDFQALCGGCGEAYTSYYEGAFTSHCIDFGGVY